MVIATVVVDMQVEPSHSPQDIEKEVESSVDEEKDMAMVLSLFGVEDLNLGDPDEGIPLGGKVVLHTAKCTGGRLAYVAKQYSSAREARVECYVYKKLDPLVGICTVQPMMVSRTSEGGLSFLMRTAHHVGWRSAHPSLSDKVKQSIVDALNLIHVKGVLHGDIALRHILVDDQDNVTIVDFAKARTVEDHTRVGLERCSKEDQELEMRKLKYLIGYGNSKKEERKASSFGCFAPGTREQTKHVFPVSELDEWDSEVPSERSPRFEIPSDKRTKITPPPVKRRDSLDSLNVEIGRGEYRKPRSNARKPSTSAHFYVPLRSHSAPLTEQPADAEVGAQTMFTMLDSISYAASFDTTVPFPTAHIPRPIRYPPVPAQLLRASTAGEPSEDILVDGSASSETSASSRLSLAMPIPVKSKRTFEVAFHPDTEDNSLWSTGRSMKKSRRPATPYIAALQIPEDPDNAPDPLKSYLSAISPTVDNAFEAPPRRDGSFSPVLASHTSTDNVRAPKADVQPDGDHAEEVVVVITSPTGQRRVWGVTETVASQISRILDQRPDERIPTEFRAHGSTTTTSGTKRKAEEMPETDLQPKLAKKSGGLFSRLFG